MNPLATSLMPCESKISFFTEKTMYSRSKSTPRLTTTTAGMPAPAFIRTCICMSRLKNTSGCTACASPRSRTSSRASSWKPPLPPEVPFFQAQILPRKRDVWQRQRHRRIPTHKFTLKFWTGTKWSQPRMGQEPNWKSRTRGCGMRRTRTFTPPASH